MPASTVPEPAAKAPARKRAAAAPEPVVKAPRKRAPRRKAAPPVPLRPVLARLGLGEEGDVELALHAAHDARVLAALETHLARTA